MGSVWVPGPLPCHGDPAVGDMLHPAQPQQKRGASHAWRQFPGMEGNKRAGPELPRWDGGNVAAAGEPPAPGLVPLPIRSASQA